MSVGLWGANKMRLCKGEREQAGVRRAFLWQAGVRRLAALVAATVVLLCLCAPFAGCGKAEEERAQYCIEAVYEEGVLRARMRVEAESNGELRFNLYGNAYREGAAYPPVAAAYQKSAYYGGESYGGMRVLSVSPCQSWEVAGEDENVLAVRLAKGGRAAVEIEYELVLAHIDHRTGISHAGVNLGNWYPVLCEYEDGAFVECPYYAAGDPFYSACADYDVTFTAPAELTVAASAAALSCRAAAGQKVYRYRLENARDFALVLGSFSLAQAEEGGVSFRYYYTQDDDPQAKTELLADCFSFFTKKFGRYPYGSFCAVQTGFCYGGMEYPGLVMLSDALEGRDYLYTIVHEAAHQWWYAAVGSDAIGNAWQDEGLAEYSALLFFEENEEYGIRAAQLLERAREALRAYCGVHEQIFGRADTSMARPLSDYAGGYAYVTIAYCKGMLLFDTLRSALGDDRFFAGLRRYYAENAGKIASPQDLAAAFESPGAEGVIRSFVDGTAAVCGAMGRGAAR